MEGSAEDKSVKLIGVKFSPFVNRVMIALNLKGIKYDFIEEDLQNKSELLLRTNPVYKKVPVFIHDGKPVCESLIILHYIDQVWDSSSYSILPRHPYERAVSMFWASFIDNKVFNTLLRICTNLDKQSQKNAAEKVMRHFRLLEAALKTTFGGKDYFGGEKVGYVDIALGTMYSFTKAAENLGNTVLIDAEKMPLLDAWMARFCESEGVKGILPDPQIIVEFIKKTFHSKLGDSSHLFFLKTPKIILTKGIYKAIAFTKGKRHSCL